MIPNQPRIFAFVLALVAMAASAPAADAGWVLIRNDSNKTITVQEVVSVNGRVYHGKPVKLTAGESFREYQNTPAARAYEVLDAGSSNSRLWYGQLPCHADTQSFAITASNGKVRVIQTPGEAPAVSV